MSTRAACLPPGPCGVWRASQPGVIRPHADRDRKIHAHVRQLRALGLDVPLAHAA